MVIVAAQANKQQIQSYSIHADCKSQYFFLPALLKEHGAHLSGVKATQPRLSTDTIKNPTEHYKL